MSRYKINKRVVPLRYSHHRRRGRGFVSGVKNVVSRIRGGLSRGFSRVSNYIREKWRGKPKPVPPVNPRYVVKKYDKPDTTSLPAIKKEVDRDVFRNAGLEQPIKLNGKNYSRKEFVDRFKYDGDRRIDSPNYDGYPGTGLRVRKVRKRKYVFRVKNSWM